MSVPCICGHAAFLHADGGCLRYFLSCHCPCYHPDDGTDPGTTSVDHRADPYDGQYGTDRKWAL